jgi:hypothetical protein
MKKILNGYPEPLTLPRVPLQPRLQHILARKVADLSHVYIHKTKYHSWHTNISMENHGYHNPQLAKFLPCNVNSFISIATRLHHWRPQNCSSIPRWGKRCLFLKTWRSAERPTQPHNQQVPWALYKGVRRPRHEANHSPTLSTKLRTRGATLQLPMRLHGGVVNEAYLYVQVPYTSLLFALRCPWLWEIQMSHIITLHHFRLSQT